jgi:hypothetical protein
MADKESPTEPVLLPENDNSENLLPGDAPGKPQITFMGNTIDLSAFSALMASGIVAFSCLTCNMGYYCLPLIPLLLGIIGLTAAREAVDQKRTRWMSWVGVGVGGGIFAMLMVAIIAYILLMIVAVAISLAAEGSNF